MKCAIARILAAAYFRFLVLKFARLFVKTKTKNIFCSQVLVSRTMSLYIIIQSVLREIEIWEYERREVFWHEWENFESAEVIVIEIFKNVI